MGPWNRRGITVGSPGRRPAGHRLRLGPPVGRTPNLAQFHRSREILAWVGRAQGRASSPVLVVVVVVGGWSFLWGWSMGWLQCEPSELRPKSMGRVQPFWVHENHVEVGAVASRGLGFMFETCWVSTVVRGFSL